MPAPKPGCCISTKQNSLQVKKPGKVTPLRNGKVQRWVNVERPAVIPFLVIQVVADKDFAAGRLLPVPFWKAAH